MKNVFVITVELPGNLHALLYPDHDAYCQRGDMSNLVVYLIIADKSQILCGSALVEARALPPL